MGRLIHLVEHTGGARRENLLQVVIIFDSYLFRENYFVFLQLLERGKEENWGVEFVWVTPGLAFSFFVSHIFLFFCLLFSFSLQASPSFLQPISGHAPLPLHKKRSMTLKTLPLPSVAAINENQKLDLIEKKQ